MIPRFCGSDEPFDRLSLDRLQVLPDFLGVGLERVLHGEGRAAAKLKHRPVDHIRGKGMFLSQEAGGGR